MDRATKDLEKVPNFDLRETDLPDLLSIRIEDASRLLNDMKADYLPVKKFYKIIARLLLVRTKDKNIRRLLDLIMQDKYNDVAALGDETLLAAMKDGRQPYAKDAEKINNIAKQNGLFGALLLNFAEVGCTNIIAMDRNGHPVMAGIMDWAFEGLGRLMVTAFLKASKGNDYKAITLPGHFGILRVDKPDAFAAAIHVAPFKRRTGIEAVDRVLNGIERARTLPDALRRGKLLPSHALRLVSDQCDNYRDAVLQFASQDFTNPALCVFRGINTDEACVVQVQGEGRPVVICYFGEKLNIHHALEAKGKSVREIEHCADENGLLVTTNSFKNLLKKERKSWLSRMKSAKREKACRAHGSDIKNYLRTVGEDGWENHISRILIPFVANWENRWVCVFGATASAVLGMENEKGTKKPAEPATRVTLVRNPPPVAAQLA